MDMSSLSSYVHSMGSRLGVIKIAAKRAGLSLEEYQDRIDRGLKRCTFCEEWKLLELFDTDNSRGDGKTAGCSECRSERARAVYGPKRGTRRPGDKKQARARVNKDVELNLRSNPNDLHCVKCGHKGPDRRHEYHHTMGYEPIHHYDVMPFCSVCHHREHPNGKD
jgi:hypothetical protein